MFASLEVIAKLRKELDAAEAAWLREVAEYDRSYDWQAEGFASAASALRHACHMSQGVARAHVELARKLENLPEVAGAFADGEISARHATAIANSYTPERAAEINEVEGALVEYAREATPHDLARVVKYVTDSIDGDGGADAEEARYQRRRLHMSRTIDDMLVEDGLFDSEAALIREAAIDAEMARDHRAHDDRTTAQRRADASTNIMRLSLERGEAGESHGVRPHISYVVQADRTGGTSADLVARARAERRNLGSLSATMIELLLCDCDVSRVIVAGRSEILDVGRASRTPTAAQWKALVVRDRHCQHPGCYQPPSRCAAHHKWHWTRGGPTDLENLEMLCWFHHRLRHIQEAIARAPRRITQPTEHSTNAGTTRHSAWMASYSESAVELSARHLRGGFFEGWAVAPDPDEHLRILLNSTHVVIARDEVGAVIGFVTALSDGVLSAYIPLLEVLPADRGKGVGTDLVRRLLGILDGLYMIDVMCDADVRPFYERLGFVAANGAAMRNYDWRSRAER